MSFVHNREFFLFKMRLSEASPASRDDAAAAHSLVQPIDVFRPQYRETLI